MEGGGGVAGGGGWGGAGGAAGAQVDDPGGFGGTMICFCTNIVYNPQTQRCT